MAEAELKAADIPAPLPPPDHPNSTQQAQQSAQQAQQIEYLNWSHFKPEFSGKPEEDAETHLLRTNDWMNTHHFREGVKVQRFFLTLVGEARL